MKTIFVSESMNGLDIKAEVRRMRAVAKKIASSKKAAIRFLASTGMYTATGRLKKHSADGFAAAGPGSENDPGRVRF